MARTPPGLTDDQVAALRTAATGARKPRVRLLGTQFGDDVTGVVQAVGDPATDGDEFISVKVKVGSVTDTLVMGPTELAIPGRRDAAKSAPKTAAARRTVPKTPAPRPPSTPKPAPAAKAPSTPKPAPATKAPSAPKPAPAARPAPRRAGGKRKAPPSVTVTVSSSGSAWKLTATRGGRSLVKATELAPGVVTGIADLIADGSLQEAVAEVNDQSLAVAEERARQLREELAAVESLLQAHQRPGR